MTANNAAPVREELMLLLYTAQAGRDGHVAPIQKLLLESRAHTAYRVGPQETHAYRVGDSAQNIIQNWTP